MYRLPVLTDIQNELMYNLKILSSGITNTSTQYKQLAKKHWDAIAKPLDSLGEFERIFQKLSAIKNVLLLCVPIMEWWRKVYHSQVRK